MRDALLDKLWMIGTKIPASIGRARLCFDATETYLFRHSHNDFNMKTLRQQIKLSNKTFEKSIYYVFLAMPREKGPSGRINHICNPVFPLKKTVLVIYDFLLMGGGIVDESATCEPAACGVVLRFESENITGHHATGRSGPCAPAPFETGRRALSGACPSVGQSPQGNPNVLT